MATGQLEHRWGGQGQQAMGGADTAMARRRWRSDQMLDAQMQQGGAHPDHIHQGINRAHLRKMHLLGVDPMDVCLRLSQQ